jgi:hypothetical protein
MHRAGSTGRAWRAQVWAGLAAAGLIVAAGCATTDPRDPYDDPGYSDIPWNQPQTWEGTIPMPMPGGGGSGW